MEPARRRLNWFLVLLSVACLWFSAGHAARAVDAPPRSGGSYFGSTSRIRGFDPITAGDTASAAAIYKLYEGLLEYKYLARPYEVRPLLADGLPEISEDGLTYTFRIKRGVRFHDDPCFPGGKGRELVAEDFVYGWKRVADVNNRSTGYWIFEGRIVGLDEFREQSKHGPVDYDTPVAGLQTPDRYTFQVKLTQPYPQLMWVLTMDYAFAVPREAVEYHGQEFLNHPVGTGPYIIHDWRRGYRIEYRKNPTYHGDFYPTEGSDADRAAGLLGDAGQPLPFLDRVVQYVVADPSTEWLMFLAGRLASSGISQNNFDAVMTNQRELTPDLVERGIRLFKSPQMRTDYVGFNMKDPVVGTNRALRQALACAFDVAKWIEYYNDRMVPARGPIPPGVAGYDPDRDWPYVFDLEKARQRLAEAGYPGGIDPATGKRLSLTIDIGSAADPEVRQSVDLMASFYDAAQHRAETALQQLAGVSQATRPQRDADVSPGLDHRLPGCPEFSAVVLQQERLARAEPRELQQPGVRPVIRTDPRDAGWPGPHRVVSPDGRPGC